MPALMKFIMMPPPMVPAPMMPTYLMSRIGVSSGTSAIFEAARSAWKMWRSARDSGVCISAEEQLAFGLQAFVERLADRRRPRLPRTSAARGSSSRTAPTVLRANCRKASAFGCLTFRSRTRLSGSLSATAFSAKATAPSTRSPSMMASSSGVPANFAAGAGAPGHDDVQRGLEAHQARQALRAAGARQQAELHFGQAQLGVGLGHAEVRAQGQLEAAAERHASDGRDHRLGRTASMRLDHVAEVRAPCRPWRVPNSRTSAPPENARSVPVIAPAP